MTERRDNKKEFLSVRLNAADRKALNIVKKQARVRTKSAAAIFAIHAVADGAVPMATSADVPAAAPVHIDIDAAVAADINEAARVITANGSNLSQALRMRDDAAMRSAIEDMRDALLYIKGVLSQRVPTDVPHVVPQSVPPRVPQRVPAHSSMPRHSAAVSNTRTDAEKAAAAARLEALLHGDA